MVTKPLTDTRLYKQITLPNQLKVLLVSDPTTSKSSASLDVNIGSFNDTVEGIAHLLEHLLFMGTTKYPNENHYSDHLHKHNGNSNAYTSSTSTNYYFEVDPSHLNLTMDIFLQFFLCPLFLSVDREIQAVDSEYQKNIPNLNRRVFSALQACSLGPFSRFSCGNATTLTRSDILEQVKEFYRMHYSSNLMRLVVLGRESLEELEAMARGFGDIENKNLERSSYTCDVFPTTQKTRLIHVLPQKDTKRLSLYCAIPETNLRTKPLQYISHLVGHESRGSILFLLKQLELATHLVCGGSRVRGYELFHLSVELTRKGYNEYQSVVDIVFQYLRLLQDTQEWIFDEKLQLNLIHFNYQDKQQPSQYTSQLSNQMQLYDNDELLVGPFQMEYDPSEIKKVLEMITPTAVQIILVGEDRLEGAYEKEKWYGAEYQLREVDLTLSSNIDSRLHLPHRNPYIPRSLSVNNSQASILTRRGNLTFLKHAFLPPKSIITVIVKSPIAYSTPFHSVLMKLYTELLKDHLQDMLYHAELAGNSMSVEAQLEGVVLQLGGYTDTILQFYEDVTTQLQFISFDRIEVYKQHLKKLYTNWNKESALSQVGYYLNYLMQERLWSSEEKLRFVDSVTVDDMRVFIRELFMLCDYELFIHSDKDIAIPVFESTLQSNKPRAHLVEKEFIFTVKNKDTLNPNNAIEYFIQLGENNSKNRVYALILKQMLQERCFDQLRTKEQLGYVVSVGFRRMSGIVGVRIVVMSSYSCKHLEQRIDAFLRSLDLSLDYEKHIQSVKMQLEEKDECLGDENARYLQQIQSGYYEFDYRETDIQTLEHVTKEEVEKLYASSVHPDSRERKKVSVHFRKSDCKEEYQGDFLNEENVKAEKCKWILAPAPYDRSK